MLASLELLSNQKSQLPVEGYINKDAWDRNRSPCGGFCSFPGRLEPPVDALACMTEHARAKSGPH